MTDRPIKGDGIAHEQNYIEERLEDTTDVEQYAEATQKLKAEERDLENIERGGKQSPPPTG